MPDRNAPPIREQDRGDVDRDAIAVWADLRSGNPVDVAAIVARAVRIIITPAAYAVIKATLARGANEPPPQRDAAGRFVICVEETYVDQLKALRRSGENYSDVILKLAEPEGTRVTVVKLAERG